MTGQVLRIFQARPRPGKEQEYERYLRETTLPFLRRQHGMLEVRLARSRGPASRDLVLTTLWTSAEALSSAARRQPDRVQGDREEGVVDREREAPLLEDFTCTHYEVLDL